MNVCIFQDQLQDLDIICLQIVNLEKEYFSGEVKIYRPRILKIIQHFNGAFSFFDGAAKDGYCAAGVVLFLYESHRFTFRLHCGSRTNMKVELLALWCICKVNSIFYIVTLMV